LPKKILELINPQVQQYAEAFSSAEDEWLQEISAYTRQHLAGEHHMLSGHLQGKVLELISCMLQPRRILEIGTFTGYSALCLVRGLPKEGQLHTIEMNAETAAIAKHFFDRSPFSKQIILHTGDALQILPNLNETWDLVFIDAYKPAYIQYFNLVFPKVRKNGIILADNIFFHGQALEANPKSAMAKGIKAFNEFIMNNTDVEKVVLTVRDGLYFMMKK
jgi:caffeoyl-CoA O-methyltransferase